MILQVLLCLKRGLLDISTLWFCLGASLVAMLISDLRSIPNYVLSGQLLKRVLEKALTSTCSTVSIIKVSQHEYDRTRPPNPVLAVEEQARS